MAVASKTPLLYGRAHIDAIREGIDLLYASSEKLDAWGRDIAAVVGSGRGRLLAAGNGGSAAQAQHLTAELVGRYFEDRRPFSAIALHAETSSLTALVNDYPPDEVFARQVHAHGRQGDVLLLLSTSGKSRNLLLAVEAAREVGVRTLGLTGKAPNPLADACDDAVAFDARSTATVQELHQIAVHLLCASCDVALAAVD